MCLVPRVCNRQPERVLSVAVRGDRGIEPTDGIIKRCISTWCNLPEKRTRDVFINNHGYQVRLHASQP